MRRVRAIIRFFLAGFFLYSVFTTYIDRVAFIQQLYVGTGTHGVYVAGNVPVVAGMLQQYVHPHAQLFALFVLGGLAVVGVLLLLGLCTRVAACIGMVMNIGFLLATLHIQQGGIGAYSLGFNCAFLVMELAVLLTAPGRFFGLDALWRRK